ncbi:RNA ligase family protein [Clostridium beijerinckii]|uniref:ATP-dependent DNA ligase n=1 Tax=Clostridium beijerinckii TaxID=1520 RepID=UPI00156E549A|nr:RNA ligase family protein [Clostridium beijerinckii]NRU52612.1 DNA ligase-1 [Clostridium beijerinckii]NYC68655.1 DNA ligase-1 [Clostridium beijerinckii]NYC91804.1 DNA ligase-1 [Clostridium beijerinckii]
MKEVIEIVQKLRNESSTNGKIAILQKNKDNELLKKVLLYTYDPFKKYGMSEKSINPINSANFTIDIFELLDILSSSNINDSLRATANSFLGSIQNENEMELYKCILLKDLRMGINAKGINKVWKDLIPQFNVMLADKYFEKPQKVKGKEFIITQKLDGCRFVLIKDENGQVKYFTRQGQEIEGLVEFEEDSKKIPNNTVIDGELLLNIEGLHSKDLYRETMKESRKKGVKHGLALHAFDILTFEEFKQGISKTKCKERKEQLSNLISVHGFTNIIEVPIRYIGKDESVIIKLLDEAIANDEEGVMVNLSNAPYECKRTSNILKVKKFQDADLKVLSIEEGEGKNKGTLGRINVEYKNNTIGVGSGFSDEMRNEVYNNPNKYIGKIAKIQYFEETTNSKDNKPSLRFPVFLEWRFDKCEPSYY